MKAYPTVFDLTGKTALITGGAGLMGVEHAHALAECGAKVVITDVNPDSVAQTVESLSALYREQIFGQVMDVTQETSILSVHEKLVAEHGGVRILINNAAIDPKVDATGIKQTSRFENFPIEQWDLQVRVGLTGSFLCSQVFGSWMAKKGGGVILNISSDLSVIAPDQRLYRKDGLSEDQQPVKPVTYSVIKTGLVGLTRYLAGYWAGHGVRVNALSPGGIYKGQDEVFVQKLKNLIPMGRMAQKNEYRGVVQFLCSNASQYMTGQNVVCDGGRSVL